MHAECQNGFRLSFDMDFDISVVNFDIMDFIWTITDRLIGFHKDDNEFRL